MVEMVGYSVPYRDLLRDAAEVGRIAAPILIEGETGSGKELLARKIHEGQSEQPKGSFLKIDCASVAPTLSFGDFHALLIRLSEEAEYAPSNITLFLDELADLPLPVQPYVPMLLPDGPAFNLAEDRLVTRIIAATSTDLKQRVKVAAFNSRVYQFFQQATIKVPPLRERRDDIPVLVSYFLRRYQPPRRHLRLSKITMRALSNYNWPGNIRELENCIRRAAILADGDLIRLRESDLPGAPPSSTNSPSSRYHQRQAPFNI